MYEFYFFSIIIIESSIEVNEKRILELFKLYKKKLS